MPVFSNTEVSTEALVRRADGGYDDLYNPRTPLIAGIDPPDEVRFCIYNDTRLPACWQAVISDNGHTRMGDVDVCFYLLKPNGNIEGKAKRLGGVYNPWAAAATKKVRLDPYTACVLIVQYQWVPGLPNLPRPLTSTCWIRGSANRRRPAPSSRSRTARSFDLLGGSP